jgi:hypothetical protein
MEISLRTEGPISMAVDLHSHSTASDGSFSPAEMARLFAANGVDIAGLTDHDTMGGGPEFLEACDAAGITGIVGIELSTVLHDGTEAHILGYGLPSDDPKWAGFLNRHWDYLRSRCERTLALLAQYGYRIDLDTLYRLSGGNPPMPPHIIMVVALNGGITSIAQVVDFFFEYLNNDAKAWVPHETPVESVIGILNEVGAVSIVSHPNRYPGIDRLEELLDMGARGFELYYPEQNGAVFERLESIARKRDCLVTGGCDYHGAFTERRIGEVEVPLEVAERLFEAIGREMPVPRTHLEGGKG